MTRISSSYTFVFKRVFPVFLLGMVAIALITVAYDSRLEGAWALLTAAGLVTVIGFIVLRTLIWDLADAVYDGGGFLLVRKHGEEERIPLSKIASVSDWKWMNPPRVTLGLSEPGRFGNEVVFLPKFRLGLPFATYPIVQDLIDRTGNSPTRK